MTEDHSQGDNRAMNVITNVADIKKQKGIIKLVHKHLFSLSISQLRKLNGTPYFMDGVICILL